LSTKQRRTRIVRYLPQVVIATVIVAVGPIAAIWALRSYGVITSPALAVVLGTVLAFGLSYLGATLWKSRQGAGDLLFSELMLWGWIRRLLIERSIDSTVALLDGIDDDATLSPERREQLLVGLANALDAGDPYTSGHSRRVARHAEMIARRLGLSAHEISKVRTAAALHDIGKLDTPRPVLHKRGRLTDDEFAVIKQHPVRGADIIATLGDPELSDIVRHHHERIDGTGYPDGLAGDEIPLAARVIAVADTFDAIVSTRPYRPGAPHRQAIEVLTAEAGTQLDPTAVRAFTSVYSGHRPLSVWMVFTSAPERVFSWLGGSVNSVAAASVARVMTATAVTTAAAAGAITAPMLARSAPNLTTTQAALASLGAGSRTANLLSAHPPAAGTRLSGSGAALAGAGRRAPGAAVALAVGPASLLVATPRGRPHGSASVAKILASTVPAASGTPAVTTAPASLPATPAAPAATSTTPVVTAPTTTTTTAPTTRQTTTTAPTTTTATTTTTSTTASSATTTSTTSTSRTATSTTTTSSATRSRGTPPPHGRGRGLHSGSHTGGNGSRTTATGTATTTTTTTTTSTSTSTTGRGRHLHHG